MIRSVLQVDSVSATIVSTPYPQLQVTAAGMVRTGGWSRPHLNPRVYVEPPEDGVLELDFVADAPFAPAIQVLRPIEGSLVSYNPEPWIRGVRVYSETNSMDAQVLVAQAQRFADPDEGLRSARAILTFPIASFEDSWQPTGSFCGFLKPEMKKLRHDLVLIVEGPDEARIRACVAQALTGAVVAALVAAFTTGGVGLGPAIAAAVASLQGCLGESFSVRFDRRSEWVHWCV
jgi:hypothetical protein